MERWVNNEIIKVLPLSAIEKIRANINENFIGSR